MTQLQQIQPHENDAALFQKFQVEQFQEWKQSQYPYRNQERPNNTWKWILAIVLMAVVAVVSFLLVKNRGKIAKPLLKKSAHESEESEAETPDTKPSIKINGKKVQPRSFSKLDQHRDFRDASLAGMTAGTQTFEEFIAWLVSEQGFEKVEDDFYLNQQLGCEVKVGKHGIDIYAGSSEEPVFRAFTEITALDFREKFLNLIAE